MNHILTLSSLFFTAFLAASILPVQSEAILVGLQLSGGYSIIVLLAVATAGNVLGACLNWLLGRYLSYFQHKKWFPVKEKMLNKASQHYERFGVWTLLLAWMPVIGDPLTIIAGVFRTHFLIFLPLVTIGKLVRYVIVILAMQPMV